MRMRRWLLAVVMVVGCGGNKSGAGSSGEVVTADAAAKACISALACGLPLGMVSADAFGVTGCAFGVRFVNAAPEATSEHIGPSEVDCMARAGSDCSAVASCLNGGKGAAPCKQSSGCDGTVILS